MKPHHTVLPDFLPGQLRVSRGSTGDYRSLSMFHYTSGPPATYADVWTICYREGSGADRTVAVGVLSYPVPSCRARERFFGWIGPRRDNLRRANASLRTISRVVVHPQFRAIGLGSILVRILCSNCPTRYVEAIAVMGHVHPLFQHAGMTHVNPGRLDEPAYFVLDRLATHSARSAA